ncbi:SLAP domain-containing protein [Brevibacillus sp. SYSU BS000544]|uniref:SLAP domain-containing protein n=1 Tax=Brevibacillus sp. SYSU BS000544 TaxID=3416443 RepID=UPI003CE58E6A
MSWLLENMFGKENIDEVKDDVHTHLQAESYIGVSGIENPEQSSNRVPAKELFLSLHGDWEHRMQEPEIELLQFIHDALPPIVRDEVGIIPFFTNVLNEGYLVLTFVRNASNKDITFNKLPLSLVDPEGNVVASKTFDMITFGGIGDNCSRPCEFLFRWEEFSHIPKEEVPLRLTFNRPLKGAEQSAFDLRDGLTEVEKKKYEKIAQEQITINGDVELRVLGIDQADEGGLRVVVLFQNGLDKSLEFTEVPIIIQTLQGEEIARVHYGLKNLQVAPNTSRLWGFHVPKENMRKANVKPEECKAVIPKARPENPRDFGEGGKGLIQ